MRTELIPLTAISQAHRDRWAELAATALEPNPFHDPDYVIPLARGLGQLDGVSLLVARRDDAWAACLPVHRSRSFHRVPLPSLSTWVGHRLYSLLGTPLVAAEQTDVAVGALIDALAGAPNSFFSAFGWLVEDGPVHRALRSAIAERRLRALQFERFERAFLTRRPQEDYLEQTISPKHRADLRRQKRRLVEQLGSELEVVDRAGEGAAVEELIELEGRSALAARGSVLRSDPGHARFFREMCGAMADRGLLELLFLRAGEQTLAATCNLLSSTGVFCFKIVYDGAYARFSPGIQLALEMVRTFHERAREDWIDSCADSNNAMVNRLWSQRRALVTLIVASPGIRGVVTVPALAGARAARNRMIARADK